MLWFIDAFAGEGQDDAGSPGSPLIAAEIAKAINAEYYPEQSPKKGMHVLAIEANLNRYERLKGRLAAHSAVAAVRPGQLQDRADILFAFLSKHRAPALFFLDPFGVNGLDAELLPRILALEQAEILLLLSDEGALRLAAKAEAKVPSKRDLLAKRRDGRIEFGKEFDAETDELDRTQIERTLMGHASNTRAAEILDRAFGSADWRSISATVHQGYRRAAFVDLYGQVLKNSGATHVLPFAVSDGKGRRKYTLIHASKHPAAFEAMKEAMHSAHASRPKSEPAADLFADIPIETADPKSDQLFSSGVDITEVANAISRHFAGSENVRWTNPGSDDIRSYALRNTPILKHELPLLEKTLIARGLQRSRSPRTYSFPT